jgi:hypothetical protein
VSIFKKKDEPKPVEVPVPEESKPKFVTFDSDEYKAMTLEATHEVEITLRDGGTIRVVRKIAAYPRTNQLAYYPFNRSGCDMPPYHPATEDDLLHNLRNKLKEIGKEGLFLRAEDVDQDDKTSLFEAGQYIPPANIVGLAYRKLPD